MEDGNHLGVILWIIFGIAILAACGIVSMVLLLLALLVI